MPRVRTRHTIWPVCGSLSPIFGAIALLLAAIQPLRAAPSDIGTLIRSKSLEERVLIPHQIEASLQELNTQPKELNLRTILELHAGSREEVRAVVNVLNTQSDLTVSVRLLNSQFFDDNVSQDYRDRLKDFAFTGGQRDGFKFFQQVGEVPIREELWRELSNSESEDIERIFTEARSGGEVVVLDGEGKLYRLTKSFSISGLSEKEGLDGVALLGEGVYTNLATIGQTIATAVSSSNESLFDLSEAIPSIYAFSLRRMGEESSGSTIQYYISVGLSSSKVDNTEPLYEQVAIIPVSVRVDQQSLEVCDNGSDDDGDGSADCGDSDCSGLGNCITPSEDCYNGTDDDMDGAADCSDSDCSFLASCSPPVEICDNGSDDDSDGSYDCSDSDCAGSFSCVPPSEDCSNGTDDDGDWYTDCSDSDCQNTYTCTACSADCPYGGGACNCAPSWWGWGSCSCDCSSCPQQPLNPEFLTLSESQSYPLGCYSDEFSFQARLPMYGDHVVYVDGQNVRNLGWTSGDLGISVSLSPGYHQLSLVNQSNGGSTSVHISTYYSCELENCSDGYDNNGNGYVDCSDPDCSGYWACYSTPEVCYDGWDNDNDGATDCSDYECSSASNCSTQPEYCYDGYDNDGDGAVDCNDSDCPGCIVYYEQCDNYSDDDYDGLVDCSDSDCSTDYRCHPPREYDCANGADDNWNWMIDCADPDCVGHEECIYRGEICDDAVDNDGDSLIDCEDVEQCACAGIELCSQEGDEDGNGYADCRDKRCEFYPACAETVHEECTDGIDNDDNGAIDCDDYWCREQAVCIPTEDCAHPGDDDGDGAADCDDSDCSSADNCVEKVEDCANGEDDDEDGRIDADDPSCRGSEVIPAEGTPLASLDPIFGIRISEHTAQIASISGWTWKLQALPPREEGGAAANVEPRVLDAVYVEIRDGVIEGFFAYEERGVFREYLIPNTRYRLTVSLRGLDVNGAEIIVAEQDTAYFTTPDVAVLPEGVVLVRHDVVLGSRAVPTATPTETATPTPSTSEADCADGVDNDGDGQSDCLDMDCNGNSACYTCVSTGAESCGNGFDDDCDGAADCSDGDCSEAVECENGGNAGGTTGGTTGTTPPSPNIPFVAKISEKGTIGILCGEKTFDAEVSLPAGGASDSLTLMLSEMYYTAQKDPKTGAMIGVPQYRAIQSESFTSLPQLPVVLRFNSGAGTYRLELVNYLGARSYQTIINFDAKENCAPTPTPTEEPEEPTPTPDPTDTPEPTPTPTPTPKQDDEDSEDLCGNGTKDPGEQCDPGGSTSECGEKAFCDGTCNCSSSEKAPKCFVCVYGGDNPGQEGFLRNRCSTLWSEAQKKGANKKFIIFADDFPNGLDGLAACDPDLIVELISHGVPSDEPAFVGPWEKIVDLAPQCAAGDMEIKVNNCSNFAVSGGALREAKKMAEVYAERGYTGTLKVTGNQYLTEYYLSTGKWVTSRLGGMWQPGYKDPVTGERIPVGASVELIAAPFRIVGTVLLPYRVVRKKIQELRDPGAQSQNSWLTLNICSEGVESILPPCKKAGEIVRVDLSTGVSQSAVTMVACSHNGRRANQNCTPLEEQSEGTTMCEIQEPVLCTK